MLYPTGNGGKNQDHNTKSSPKFGIATYTKEIVKIKIEIQF